MLVIKCNFIYVLFFIFTYFEFLNNRNQIICAYSSNEIEIKNKYLYYFALN